MKTSLSMDASDQKKTRMKLKKFLIRRPTYQAVRDKGYIKGSARRRGRAGEPSEVRGQTSNTFPLMFADQVFGSSLSSLCQRENTSVPNFVRMCIDHVENTGMTLSHTHVGYTGVISKHPLAPYPLEAANHITEFHSCYGKNQRLKGI